MQLGVVQQDQIQKKGELRNPAAVCRRAGACVSVRAYAPCAVRA